MASHTATSEWQSFELRMRRRRVERLLLHADAAVQQGCLEEARECLDEARRLAPGLPGIDAIERKLDQPLATIDGDPGRVASSSGWGWILPLGIAAAAVVALAVAGRPDVPLPADDLRALRLAPRVAEMRPMPGSQRTVEPRRTEALDAASSSDVPLRAPETEIDDAVVASLPALNPVSPAVNPVSPAPPPPPPPGPALVVAPMAAAVASGPIPLPPANTTMVVPAAEPPPSAIERGDAGVRDTLSRYADAYNTLDAAAAERVWPGVNRASLARAFDALASQHVSLGDCRIGLNGATARASCSGTTTWAPKVGDGTPRREGRQWTFDLVRSGESWQIVSARVQNR
jgi:hypothetical protein